MNRQARLSEWAVARAAIDEPKRHGDQWKLDEELPQRSEIHSTPTKYIEG
jgi:hypothetical protein